MEKSNAQKRTFLNLYGMVMADGICHPKEMAVLYKIGRECYHLTSEEISQEIREGGKTPLFPQSFEDRVRLLYQMAIIAWADGNVDETERDLLKRYSSKYCVREEIVDSFVDFLLEKAKQNISEANLINELK